MGSLGRFWVLWGFRFQARRLSHEAPREVPGSSFRHSQRPLSLNPKPCFFFYFYFCYCYYYYYYCYYYHYNYNYYYYYWQP